MSHTHRHTSGPEHDFEAQHGLPEALPKDEHLLWQGAPDFKSLALRSFHVRKLAIYFVLMVAARAASDLALGVPLGLAAITALKFAAIGAAGVALVLGLAWLTARTTVYTLTDKRMVMRIGIVLSVSYNLPLSKIEAADMSPHGDGSGHLALTLTQPHKIAYLHLWPHARPWKAARPQPMLLCVPDAQHVASLVTQAWAKAHGQSPVTLVASASQSSPPLEQLEPHAAGKLAHSL